MAGSSQEVDEVLSSFNVTQGFSHTRMNTEKASRSLVSLHRVLSRECWGAMGPLRLQNKQEKILTSL